MIGTEVGLYELVGLLGEGGMGAVYEGVHKNTGRRAAIKILRQEFTRKEDVVQRFFREALAVNLIDHPSLVQVHDCGHLADGSHYLIMELIEGQTLGHHLRDRGCFPEREVARIGAALAETLAAAHEKGIIHRDLKPGNVMLTGPASGPLKVKLLDFGIAKLTGEATAADAFQTRAGTILGTPTYMSPEQCRGTQNLDGKSDVYSLGVMLYHCVAGRPPFVTEGSEIGLLALHLMEPVPLLDALVPGIDPELASVIERMLAKRKEDRPAMSEVAAALGEIAKRATPKKSSEITPIRSLQAPTLSSTELAPLRPLQAPPPEPTEVAPIRPLQPAEISHPSTLRQANGQVTPAAGRSRSTLIGGAVLGVVLLVGVALVALSLRSPATTKPAGRPTRESLPSPTVRGPTSPPSGPAPTSVPTPVTPAVEPSTPATPPEAATTTKGKGKGVRKKANPKAPTWAQPSPVID